MIKLHQLLKETDALTYINALKVTQAEIKDEAATQEELARHLMDSVERSRKLLRKADNQYRVIVKLVQQSETSTTSDVLVMNTEVDEDMEKLMEEVD